MRRAWVLVVLSACGGDPEAPPPVGAIEASITAYEYRFDVDSRVSHSTVTATVDVEGDCLALPFRAELAADTVTIDGAPAVSATAGDGTITVCGPGHRAGDTLVLDTDQTIPMTTLDTSQVGYSITRDRDGNDFYYLVSWVGGCDRFGPCDNRPDKFATYAFDVTHPAGYLARCAGTVTDVSPTNTRCVFDHEGGPTYSTFGVAVYPAWTQTSKGTWGSVAVTVYDRAGTTIDAAIDSTYHAGFVQFMEQNFGPYPYGSELRILTAPTYWSGFEHPGNIVLSDNLNGNSEYRDPVAHVLDHEIAHQWAGDETTLADTYDFVWKEAMAEYLSYVYEDTVDARTALTTAQAWKTFSGGARFYPVPEDRPELFDYYGDVYGPGPMVLFRQLEVLSSREQVMAAIRSVLGTQRSLSVDELLAALATSTGLDLTAYTDAWIRGSGAPEYPRFTTQLTVGAKTSTLAVQQTNPNGKTCKFHVGLFGANPTVDVVHVEVDTFRNGIDQVVTFPTPGFAVTQTVVDSLRECLVFSSGFAPAARSHPWLSGRVAPP
jgi:aminopeptidase N